MGQQSIVRSPKWANQAHFPSYFRVFVVSRLVLVRMLSAKIELSWLEMVS